jgi:methyltransferase (TIGR00027 family)
VKPVSKTAFYCAGARMQDAQSARPVCDDQYAARFLDEEGRRVFEPFAAFRMPNASNATRHRIIDDMVRARLRESPAAAIVLIGAGFDSRAFRLDGGRWYEFDETALIAYKNERLPAAESENPLQRIGVDFQTNSLERELGSLNIDAPLVIVEGVTMYLEESQLRELLSILARAFPRHTLVCDLMNHTFFRRYSGPLHTKLRALGASFKLLHDAPEMLVASAGYELSERVSIVGRASELGAVKIPGFLLRTLLRPLAQGYVVSRFEKG